MSHARDPRRQRRRSPASAGGRAGAGHRREARHARGRRAPADGARPREGQPAAARLHLRAAAAGALAAGRRPRQARAVRVIADRPRARAPGRGDRPRAAPPASRSGDRLARTGPGHARARGRGRAHPPRERGAGKRVVPHPVRGVRAGPAGVRGVPADGRDPRRELHALCRRGARAGVRPVDRRRGVGGRLLPAREPRAEVSRLRVVDRLRRLAADARGRRARGAARDRLQRRDG